MKLADKIIELRNIHGLSQETLSEKIDVSKLTISKWENGTSVPDLDQIIMIGQSFDVSIDYLLKDDFKANDRLSKVDLESRKISLVEITSYVTNKSKSYRLISKGVILCINSFVPLMMLLMLSGEGYIDMSTDMATAVGLILLFALVSVATSIFVRINIYNSDFEKIEKNDVELESGVKSIFSEMLDDYKPVYLKRITLSVILIIMSVVPLITVSILTDSATLSLLMVVLNMLLIGLGVYIIIPTSMHFNTLKVVVKIGDFLPQKSKELKRTEKVAAFYWPLVLAVYLGWSLWTMAWGTTWILWPVAAISFAALIGLIGLFDSSN